MDPSYIVVTKSACLGISPSACSEDAHILFIPINNNQTFHFLMGGFCKFAKWKSTSFKKIPYVYSTLVEWLVYVRSHSWLENYEFSVTH